MTADISFGFNAQNNVICSTLRRGSDGSTSLRVAGWTLEWLARTTSCVEYRREHVEDTLPHLVCLVFRQGRSVLPNVRADTKNSLFAVKSISSRFPRNPLLFFVSSAQSRNITCS